MPARRAARWSEHTAFSKICPRTRTNTICVARSPQSPHACTSTIFESPFPLTQLLPVVSDSVRAKERDVARAARETVTGYYRGRQLGEKGVGLGSDHIGVRHLWQAVGRDGNDQGRREESTQGLVCGAPCGAASEHPDPETRPSTDACRRRIGRGTRRNGYKKRNPKAIVGDQSDAEVAASEDRRQAFAQAHGRDDLSLASGASAGEGTSCSLEAVAPCVAGSIPARLGSGDAPLHPEPVAADGLDVNG